MNKYFLVAKNTWIEITIYRLNFVMWRVRNVLQLLTIYLLWMVLSNNQTIFGYTQSAILTYILVVSVMDALVLSSRTQEIGENINNGDLSMFLIKPWSYIKYWFFRDLGDKAMNLVFSVAEISLIVLLFKPPIFIQSNLFILTLFFLAAIFALFLNFLFGFLLGLLGFWSPEVWGPRFLSYVLISFFAGGAFPLDIFPKVISQTLQLLPFAYFLYFPVKLYLGQLSTLQITVGFGVSLFWILLFYLLVRYFWNFGLKKYDAVGR